MAPSILLIQSGVHACSKLASDSPHEERMLSTLGPMLRSLSEHLTRAPSCASDLQQKMQAINQASLPQPVLLLLLAS